MSEAPQRSVLMGDPSHFNVLGGANPHTRTRWGLRRHVDRRLAVQQWHGLKNTLEGLGLRVLIVPPDPAQPGLVYPANAGFQSRVDTPEPLADKVFTLANLLPTRAGEKPHYRRVLAAAGYRTAEVDEQYRFEGEADFFSAGDVFLLTHGRLERQRFVPTLGIPPWKRVYGFRTDVRVRDVLAPMVAPKEVLVLELTLEAHYHGDTALCAFGPGRRFLLAYREGLTSEGWRLLVDRFGDRLIELEPADAGRYAANSFTFTPAMPGVSVTPVDRVTPTAAVTPDTSDAAAAPTTGTTGARSPRTTPAPPATPTTPPADSDESYLVMPEGISDRLRDAVRDLGVEPVLVDVSEFLKKGGGSVKCMIGDLGVVAGRG